MATNALQQAAFPFLAAANEGERRAPAAAVARAARDRRARPVSSADARSFHPVHVTLRWLDHVHAARERVGRDALDAAVRGAAAAVSDRVDLHVFHASVRGDGVHLLVQAPTEDALASGVCAFTAAATRRVNRALCRLGPVLAEEYAVQVLRTSAEFREALRFLIGRDG
jgi:hypothetical protein